MIAVLEVGDDGIGCLRRQAGVDRQWKQVGRQACSPRFTRGENGGRLKVGRMLGVGWRVLKGQDDWCVN